MMPPAAYPVLPEDRVKVLGSSKAFIAPLSRGAIALSSSIIA
jgi:hypothetical protein